MDVVVRIKVVTLFEDRRSEFFNENKRKKRRKSWTKAKAYINVIASMHKLNSKQE